MNWQILSHPFLSNLISIMVLILRNKGHHTLLALRENCLQLLQPKAMQFIRQSSDNIELKKYNPFSKT